MTYLSGNLRKIVVMTCSERPGNRQIGFVCVPEKPAGLRSIFSKEGNRKLRTREMGPK